MDKLHKGLSLSVVVLLVLLVLSNRKIGELESALKEKPKETLVLKEKRVEGPERTVYKYVKGEVVEKIIEKDPVVIEVVRESDTSPACPPERKRFVSTAYSLDRKVDVLAGLNFRGMLDLGAGLSIGNGVTPKVQVSYRF